MQVIYGNKVTLSVFFIVIKRNNFDDQSRKERKLFFFNNGPNCTVLQRVIQKNKPDIDIIVD